MTKRTERERQFRATNSCTYVYRCEDGQIFSAVAPTESGAFRVLNAERPGISAVGIGAAVHRGGHPGLDARERSDGRWAEMMRTGRTTM